MERDKERSVNRVTWFWKWVVNNKVVSILTISLLILLNILLFSKIMPVFYPVKEFLSIIGLPIVLAGLLFYLFNPLIDWMEKKKIPRLVSIGIVFLVSGGLIVWGIIIVIPIIREQTVSLIQNWPTYWNNALTQFDHLLRSTIFSELQSQLSSINESMLKSISTQMSQVVNSTFTSIGSVVGTVTTLVIALVTMPIILFFLLKEGRYLPYHLLKIIPTKKRVGAYKLLKEINWKISQYIRGQITVAFFVGLMFWIGFAIIGLEYAVLLAILAGVLNLVPYLGSFIAMIPIVLVALVASPFMLVKVLIVFAVEQLLEGRIIQPLIIGSSLKIHPVTIIIVLLTAGKLFGIPGVILGIPAYAVLKIIFEHIFTWYQSYTGLYPTNYSSAPQPIAKSRKKYKKRK